VTRPSAAYWDGVSEEIQTRGHYLDAFLGQLKAQAYLDLIERWVDVPDTPVLKTDLFEESNAVDALLWHIQAGGLRLGTDLSPRIAARAAQHAPDASCVFLAADARHLPFTTESLGFVLSPSTLDHFESLSDLHVSLCEINRTLRPGGTLLITLANRSNIGDPLRRLVIRLGLVPYYIGASYTISQLRDELQAAGLLVCRETAIVHNPRLMATAVAMATRTLRWKAFTRLARRTMLAMQRFEGTRYRYATGSFVAALAVKPDRQADPEEPRHAL
jgi:SAM-dependent methyltransferase